jgi:hypothetical protein
VEPQKQSPKGAAPIISQGNALGIGKPKNRSPKGAAPIISQGNALGAGMERENKAPKGRP